MSITLDKIIEEVRQLPPDEQRQLREQLNVLVEPSLTEDEREDEFERYLAAKGIMTWSNYSGDDPLARIER